MRSNSSVAGCRLATHGTIVVDLRSQVLYRSDTRRSKKRRGRRANDRPNVVAQVLLVAVAGSSSKIRQTGAPIMAASNLQDASQPKNPCQHRRPVPERGSAATMDLTLGDAGEATQVAHRQRMSSTETGRDLERDLIDRSGPPDQTAHRTLKNQNPSTIVETTPDAVDEFARRLIPPQLIQADPSVPNFGCGNAKQRRPEPRTETDPDRVRTGRLLARPRHRLRPRQPDRAIVDRHKIETLVRQRHPQRAQVSTPRTNKLPGQIIGRAAFEQPLIDGKPGNHRPTRHAALRSRQIDYRFGLRHHRALFPSGGATTVRSNATTGRSSVHAAMQSTQRANQLGRKIRTRPTLQQPIIDAHRRRPRPRTCRHNR